MNAELVTDEAAELGVVLRDVHGRDECAARRGEIGAGSLGIPKLAATVRITTCLGIQRMGSVIRSIEITPLAWRQTYLRRGSDCDENPRVPKPFVLVDFEL